MQGGLTEIAPEFGVGAPRGRNGRTPAPSFFGARFFQNGHFLKIEGSEIRPDLRCPVLYNSKGVGVRLEAWRGVADIMVF